MRVGGRGCRYGGTLCTGPFTVVQCHDCMCYEAGATDARELLEALKDQHGVNCVSSFGCTVCALIKRIEGEP